jgi:hypothetical protein
LICRRIRRFFLALRVGVQDVPRPLPDVARVVQLPPDRGRGRPLPRTAGQVLAEQRDRPLDGLVSELVRSSLQAREESGLEFFRPEGRVVTTAVVGQAARIAGLLEGLDPVVDRPAADPEQPGDLGDGPAARRFQDRQGPSVEPRIARGP